MPRGLPKTIVGTLISCALAAAANAAGVDCQASRSGAGSVLYLYFPTGQDTDFPDDPGWLGISTSPLEPFDIADLDPGVGSTAQLRDVDE